MQQAETLNQLAEKYQSDKWGPHSYTPHYETHFAKYRNRPVNLLEIGVGGYDDPAAGGASLRMWNDFFPNAKIFALDFHPKSLRISDRVRIYQGDQSDPAILHRMHEDAGGFDIVVDDGSHINEHVIASFEALFPLLNDGGLYVVEDAQTSYWPILGGSSTDPDSTRTMIGYFKSLIHGLNHAEIAPSAYQPRPFDRSILSLSFYHSMVFIGKGDNSEPSNVLPSDPLRRA
jgi:hypothetical protein